MKALILAGGFGTRLKNITGEEIPKPMVSIAGKPFLEHLINYLKDQGIKEIILTVHHMSEKIKSYFGSGLRWQLDLTYSEEEIPLGTGGAIKKAQKYIDDTFIVLNGDSYSHIEIRDLLNFHKSKNSSFTICLTKAKDARNYGNVLLEENKIIEFSEKGSEKESLVNSGIYIFEPEIFNYIESNKNVSLERDIFPLLSQKRLLYGFKYDGYFMDIGRPETYEKFKQDVLSTLILRENDTVRDALAKISKSEINLVLVVDEERRLLGVLTDRVIRKFLLLGGDLKESVKMAMVKEPTIAREKEKEEIINNILFKGVNSLPILDNNGKVVDVYFRSEKLKAESFPVIRGKAPLRISLAGGTTDLPYFFEKYGGAVISSTIDKYCYATLTKRADKKIIIDSDLTPSIDVFVDSLDKIKYNGEFDLVKAVIKKLNPDFGLEIHIHNDIPPGRGLGSSASMATLLISMLSHLKGEKYSNNKIAEIAHDVERSELGIAGGWQDQYIAASGGFNFMEFSKDKNIIYPLRLKEEKINELNSRLLLCYIGKSHNSGEIHGDQQKSFNENEEEIAQHLLYLKNKAIEIKDCLLTDKLDEIGKILHETWSRKKVLSKKISNFRIDSLYETGLKNGALGGKLLGAGDGGYLLFFCHPTKRNQLTKALKEHNAEIMNFNFEPRGTQIWVA